ncbi:MAG: 2-amino-4-hydroxy-6-hydroxymethyldihydropteridine diphosphokinase [Melioribacteraceae bacterium]|nr:2-amino-4-hydroxy-6-hydroxymethyldihydropteridine diphosphokinase [Melioribacteraceae bacterium]
MSNTICYLVLGSNLGDRLSFLQKSIDLLGNSSEIKIQKVSSIYETLSYGNDQQNNYYNLALEVSTSLYPIQLLEKLKNIEKELGRTNSDKKWYPREIDIDIILFGNEKIDSALLTIPHYDLENRDFFIIPLLELNSTLILPINGQNLRDIDKSVLKINIIRKLDFQINF